MTNDTDTEIVFETYGFCATCERYTHHQCTVCAEKQAIPGDLALIKEVQALRAENERLRTDNKMLRKEMDGIVALIENVRNRIEMPSRIYVMLTDIVLVLNDILKDGQS